MARYLTIISLSLAVHLLGWWVVSFVVDSEQPKKFSQPLRIKVVPPSKKLAKQITEVEQQETAPPVKESSYLARQNHRAKTNQLPPRAVNRGSPKLMARTGIGSSVKATPQINYGKFLQQSQDFFTNDQFARGVPLGNEIDLDTSEYRYVGYFAKLRKAVELVWVYPQRAVQRQQRGVVKLRFAIHADGTASKIKVTKSSGYKILDRAVIDAIKLASPFSPLPRGFGRDEITVRGSFWYILQGF